MKKTIVIVAHPHIEKSVVNRYWVDALIGKVSFRFLADATPLDSPIDIANEQEILEQYDRIIFQFPLYWYGAPALLKRWLDEVMTFGWAYGPGGDKLEGKELGIAVSCGGAEDQFSTAGFQLYTLADYMKQYEGVAAFVRAKWIGIHAIYDTFAQDITDRLPLNTQEYLTFLNK